MIYITFTTFLHLFSMLFNFVILLSTFYFFLQFENKDHYSDNFTPVVSINNNVVNSNGNLTQSDLDFNLHSNKSDTQISTNVFDTSTPFSSNSNTLNCFNNNNLILDTFDTCHHQIPHNSTEQESTEYLLPERDYPEDDEDEDLLSSPGNQIIYSSPTDDYKKHQINPDIYQPPDLPPDTSSGIVSYPKNDFTQCSLVI